MEIPELAEDMVEELSQGNIEELITVLNGGDVDSLLEELCKLYKENFPDAARAYFGDDDEKEG